MIGGAAIGGEYIGAVRVLRNAGTEYSVTLQTRTGTICSLSKSADRALAAAVFMVYANMECHIRTVTHYLKSLGANLKTTATTTLGGRKALRHTAKLQIKTNSHAKVMGLATIPHMGVSLMATYNKRLVADAARRVLAPLRRQTWRPK